MEIRGILKPKQYTFDDGKVINGYVIEVKMPNGNIIELPVKKAKVELIEAYMSK